MSEYPREAKEGISEALRLSTRCVHTRRLLLQSQGCSWPVLGLSTNRPILSLVSDRYPSPPVAVRPTSIAWPPVVPTRCRVVVPCRLALAPLADVCSVAGITGPSSRPLGRALIGWGTAPEPLGLIHPGGPNDATCKESYNYE